MILSEKTKQVVNKGMPKKVVSILIIALIVCGGGIVAFLAMGSSDKSKYFKAELDTISFIEEQVQDRFELELDWLQFTENNPVESTVDISAQFNDPGFFGYGMIDVEEIVNNSTISVTSQTDMKNKQLTGDLNASVAGFDFSDFQFGLTDEAILVDLPFLNETLVLEGKDTGKVLHMMDPYTFDEDTEFDFSKAFEGRQSLLTEEDKKHFSKEYGQMIYEEISEDVFTSEKESVEIDDETIKAEKIVMDLSEEEIKHLLKLTLEKMQSDDYLKNLMKEQFEMSFVSQGEIDEMMAEFDEGLEEGVKGIEDINLPDGLTSTIWLDSGLIVQRSFEVVTTDNNDEESKFEVFGTQLLNETTQKLDYDITFEDSYENITLNLLGDLSRDGDKINDIIAIAVDDVEIKYESDETLTNSEREFSRSIEFDDGWTNGSLIWSGDTSYEKDQMTGNHQIHIEAEGISQDLFSLHLDVSGKKIKEVEMISDENSLNIGTMSEQELFEYVEQDASVQFMEWYFEVFGELGEMLN